MKAKRHFLVFPLLIALAILVGCDVQRVKGSGDLVTESIQVANFNSIDLSGSGEVVLTQSGSESLAIETDDNIMEYIKIEVRGGTLELGFKSGVTFIQPSRLVFYVGVDDLSGLTVSGSGDLESDQIVTNRLNMTVSGSGDIQIAHLEAGEVKASISGSGEIYLFGAADVQDVTVSGSGKYLSGDLCSTSVKVSVSGSGDATVCATETLDTNISGSGSIDYYGQPSINSSGGGSGTLHSLGDK